MADLHKNFAYSTVATAPSPPSSGTSLVVQAGDGALFPAPPFNAVLWPAGTIPIASNAEVVRVTGISTDTLTIVRAQEGSSAVNAAIGYQISNGITNKAMTDAEPGAIQTFENIPGHGNMNSVVSATAFSKTPLFIHFDMAGSMSQMRSFNFYASRAAGTSLNLTGAIGFYSLSNSTKLALVSSESWAISATTSSLWSGIRQYQVSLSSISAMDLTQGQWWLGLYMNGSNDSSAVMNMVFMGQAAGTAALNGSVFLGTNSSGATANTNQFFPMMGSLSATQATNTPFPATVAQSDVSGSVQTQAPTIYFQIQQ